MAQQVEIFNIEFGDTLQSIERLKVELKETRKLFETAKPNTAEFVKYSTEVKRLDGTIKALNGAAKDNQNALGGINQAAKFASGSYGELKQKIEQQKKALLELNVESEDFANTQKELITLQNQRIEIEKKIPSLFQERIKGAIDESNALKQLRIDLKAAQSAALNGDGAAAKKVAELKDKIDDLKDSTKSLQGSGVERLNTSVQLLTEGFQNFDADKVKTGFKGIGAAMSAIPIILIIEGIKALIENFDEVVKFAKELTGYVDENAKAVENLTNEIKLQEAANIALTSSIENEIAIMTAQGAATDDIIKKKKELVDVQIEENNKNISLSKAKIEQIKAETSIYESSKEAVLTALGFQTAAINSALKFEKERGLKIAEVNNEIAKSEADISKLKTSLTVEEINNRKKEVEAAQKAKEEKQKIWEQEADAWFAKTIAEQDAEHKLYLETEKINDLIEKGNEDSLNYILEKEKEFNQKSLQDKISLANTELINNYINGENILEQQQTLLDAKMGMELSNTELTEAQKNEIKAEYARQAYELELRYNSESLQAASNFTNSIGELSNSLFDLRRSNLEKGSEEDRAAAEKQFNVNKAFGISTALIQGGVAVINASASVPYLPVGLAASIAAAANTAATIAKISSTKFQYFDGGFTKKGNPKLAAESMGNAQFHNDEYVVPSKVKNRAEAVPHITALEKMRSGYVPSGISGFYDGGFTSRSASRNTENNIANQNNLIDFIKSIPNPIVKVTDIEKVSSSNSVAVSVSSL